MQSLGYLHVPLSKQSKVCFDTAGQNTKGHCKLKKVIINFSDILFQ